MGVRPAETTDCEAIEALYLAAFPADEGEAVASLALELLQTPSRPETYALVYEESGKILGHITFSPIYFDDKTNGYNLAPLAVLPKYQKQQIGSQLVEAGLAILRGAACEIVCVYGDPNYYGRFGFDAQLGEKFIPPYPLKYPFGWQAMSFSGDEPSRPMHFTCVPALSNPEIW